MRAPLWNRSGLRRLAIALACAGGALVHAAPGVDASSGLIKDPYYGDALFDFYLPHYFTALTTLMASQQFGRVSLHAQEAELLRGGLLLSYGLHREAGEVFERLIASGATPPARDRAWFYLAKIRYQRGLISQALEAMNRVGDALPSELADERALLHANLLMALGDNAAAAALLKAVKLDDVAGRYARFNLGVALIRDGDTRAGTALLDELGRAPVVGAELRSLRDQANLALGFAALRDRQGAQARSYLERVSLEGLQSNKALLGFGWAAELLQEPKLALVSWTELAGRDPSDAAVLEAHIALPFAYAELGAQGQALQRYGDAIALFAREDREIDASIAAVRSGQWLETLLGRNPGEEMGWYQSVRELPEMLHARQLAPVLAQNDFQEAFKNYRDLQFLAGNLQQWADKLGVFDDMLANRRQAYAVRLPQLRAKARDAGLDAAAARNELLSSELALAEDGGDGVALADPRQRELLALVRGLREALADAADNAGIELLGERVRRVEGALGWQLAQQYPARVWEARQSLALIEGQVAQARAHDGALAQAQIDEPARFERFAQRIAVLQPRIQALMPRVAALSAEQGQVAQQLAVQALQRQKERLAGYTTQARFAVAQLYDHTSSSGAADHATRP